MDFLMKKRTFKMLNERSKTLIDQIPEVRI